MYIHDHNNNILQNSLFIRENAQPVKALKYTKQMSVVIRTKNFVTSHACIHIAFLYYHKLLKSSESNVNVQYLL